jgi:FKBP-type peptidyl-prolyl cis-trans isomerase
MISRVGARSSAAFVLVLATLALAGCETTANPFSPAEFLEFETMDLQVGTGAVAATGDVLTTTNDVWLHDPDQPDKKGQQVETGSGSFVLGARQVILGLEQGLPGMRVGGLRRLIVPAALAFDRRGSATVPSNRHIVVEVMLLDVQPLITDSAPYSATDLEVGTGAEAVDGSTVTVSFFGWLYKETEPDNKWLLFDSGGGFSVVVGAGHVIAGWDRGLRGMKVGGERRLVIPPELAYGSTGRLPLIPPDATLVFDVTITALR